MLIFDLIFLIISVDVLYWVRTDRILFVEIFVMRLDNFYNFEYLDYCLHLYWYIHNLSTDASSGLLQEFLVKLHDTSNKPFMFK